MAKDSYWFKHDHNARSDKELVKVRMKMGLAGVGLYWCIVEMLYEEGGFLLRTEYERISFELQTNSDSITELIESYALFQFDDKRFWSNSVIARLATRKEKSQKARDSINKRWADTNVSKTNYESDTIRGEKKRGEIEDNKSLKLNHAENGKFSGNIETSGSFVFLKGVAEREAKAKQNRRKDNPGQT